MNPSTVVLLNFLSQSQFVQYRSILSIGYMHVLSCLGEFSENIRPILIYDAQVGLHIHYSRIKGLDRHVKCCYWVNFGTKKAAKWFIRKVRTNCLALGEERVMKHSQFSAAASNFVNAVTLVSYSRHVRHILTYLTCPITYRFRNSCELNKHDNNALLNISRTRLDTRSIGPQIGPPC